ncbi:DoxX family protein [Lacibacter sp.]|uniref:DoxX family protein n=1 Tax=Lacibacter sp. TaxID=1915409 RepID=UPI002B4B8437|nr:DoxX family protein [Lacibacter sp.]HLP39597.1 DoxX family protein [Lacibacter sp.]
MKQLVSINISQKGIDLAILITRITAAALMLSHGLPKLGMLFSGNAGQFPAVLGMSAEISLVLTVFAEVVCSIFILFGLGTRLAVVPLIITMLVAVLYIHSADPFAKQEPGIQYLILYVILFITGSGKYSLDYLLQRKQSSLAWTNR